MRALMMTMALLAACGGSETGGTTKKPAEKQKGTAMMAKGFAKSTPPAGGTSMGKMTQPKAGNQTIPITNVEVYVFTANVDDDASAETLYWAYDGTTAYVWGTIDIVCVDEDDIETGETGVAYFVLEADADTYGWLVATDSCGYSTIYGCSDDGFGETCGGCDWDASTIVCVAE